MQDGPTLILSKPMKFLRSERDILHWMSASGRA